MSESLVAIRTFADVFAADEAQVELLSAGIQSLLFTEEAAGRPMVPTEGQEIVLAVHRRDAELAESVLAQRPTARE